MGKYQSYAVGIFFGGIIYRLAHPDSYGSLIMMCVGFVLYVLTLITRLK